MKRITGPIALVCAAAALTGSARAGITFGVSEDRARSGDPAAFFATLGDLGLTENRASLTWDPAAPDVIPGQGQIQTWLPMAQD